MLHEMKSSLYYEKLPYEKVWIIKEDRSPAEDMARKIPIEGDKTWDKNLQGALAVIIAKKFYGKNCFYDDNPSHDMFYMGKRIEVKSTKLNGYGPLPEFTFLTPTRTEKQDCEYYIFCAIDHDYNVGWILGWLPKEEFISKSKLVEKGTSVGGVDILETDNYLLHFYDFNAPDLLKLILEGGIDTI